MDHVSNGRCLYYELHGPEEGPVVVLLHHGLGSVRAWKAQVPVLAAGGCRVLVYDRWGYGASGPRAHLSVPRFEDDLADLLSLVDALALPRFSLLGHSDGGTISLYFAAAAPERVERLLVVAAHVYFEPRMVSSIEAVRRSYEEEPAFREALRRVHGDKAQTVLNAWFEGWRDPANLAWDMRPELEKITCPALVVQGMQDEHATPQHALDIVTALPEGELWLVRKAAHMLPQDNSDIFNRRMLEFFVTG